MSKIVNQIILLTGASGGLGVPIARTLLQAGAIVVGVARNASKLNQLQMGLGERFIPICFDLSKLHYLDRLIDQINDKVGTIDILINNAGLEIYRRFQDYSTEELQAILNINLLVAMELTRRLLPTMQHQHQGHIISVASLAAKKGHPYDSVYSASKAGLLMWSDSLRQELFQTGIQVSVICPGYVANRGMLADTGIPSPKLSGISTPEQVAETVLRAIRYNQAESLINQDWLTAATTRMLLMLWQFIPSLGDAMYRWMGVCELNQKRIRP
ncbi:MAG: SDR family NAD(P)-dependent oxidoreductase [Leptolyngbya sp. SIO3F4]|nr:SDR family NAD(P)-dependent oxidoreductase [Leptolyngbya sp. SIO3F4]